MKEEASASENLTSFLPKMATPTPISASPVTDMKAVSITAVILTYNLLHSIMVCRLCPLSLTTIY